MTSKRKIGARPVLRTPPARAEAHDEALLHRLLFFSDAVFAIVLTLLVLELKPPQAHSADELLAGLAQMGGHFVAFALTFAVIGIFWQAHMRNLNALRSFDGPTAVVNLIHLFFICLLPFASSLLAEARFGPTAWAIYSLVLICASAANIALVVTIWRAGGRLAGGAAAGGGAYRVARAATPGLAFGLGLVALALDQLALAQLCWVLIPLLMLLFRLLLAPRPA